MKKKQVPLRKSIVSNQQFPKKDLLRITCNKSGEITIDPTGKAAGRGAYIALSLEEAELAKKKKSLDRVFQQAIDPQFYEELIAYVKHQVARQALKDVVYSAEDKPHYD